MGLSLLTVVRVRLCVCECTYTYSHSMAQGQSHATMVHILGWCPSSQVHPRVGSLLSSKWSLAYKNKLHILNQLMLNRDYYCNMTYFCCFIIKGHINASLLNFFGR